MTGTLCDFDGKIKSHLEDVKSMDQKLKQGQFRPSFWSQNSDFTVARDVFIAAGGSISHEVTKFSLVLSQNATKEQMESICVALLSPCDQLLSAAKVALFSGTGPDLANFVISSTMRILQTLLDLSGAIEAGRLNSIPQMTGRVWECCNSLSKMPKSNHIATKRNMLQCIGVIKDTIEELKEMTESELSADDESYDVELEDDFYFESALSSAEKDVVLKWIHLATLILGISKRGVISLKELQECEINGSIEEKYLSWTYRLYDVYSKINSVFVEVSPSLYPPHDKVELCESVIKLKSVGLECLNLLQSFPDITEQNSNALSNGTEKLTSYSDHLADQLSLLDP